MRKGGKISAEADSGAFQETAGKNNHGEDLRGLFIECRHPGKAAGPAAGRSGMRSRAGTALPCVPPAWAPTHAHPTRVHTSAVPARVGHGRGDISIREWPGLAAQGTGAKTPHAVTRARVPALQNPWRDRQTDGHAGTGLVVAPGSHQEHKVLQIFGKRRGKRTHPPPARAGIGDGMGRAVLPPRGAARSLHPDRDTGMERPGGRHQKPSKKQKQCSSDNLHRLGLASHSLLWQYSPIYSDLSLIKKQV